MEEFSLVSELLIDEASAELRSCAFPLLAEVETRLRRFIKKVNVTELGFDWSQRLDAVDVKPESDDESKFTGGKIQRWIDYRQFDELVEIVTADLTRTDPGESLSYGQLLDLLDDSSDLSDLREKLEGEIREKTLWDEVFSAFFEEGEEAWHEIESRLDDIVQLRHIVMHHRPFRLSEYEKLKKHCEYVLEHLPPDPELSEEEDIDEVRDRASKLGNRGIPERVLSAAEQAAMENARAQSEIASQLDAIKNSPLASQLAGIDQAEKMAQLGGIEHAKQMAQLAGIDRAEKMAQLGGIEHAKQMAQLAGIDRAEKMSQLGILETASSIPGSLMEAERLSRLRKKLGKERSTSDDSDERGAEDLEEIPRDEDDGPED